MNLRSLLTILLVVSLSCAGFSVDKESTSHYLRAQQLLSDAMVHDIFAPPAAARIYAYAGMAALLTVVPTGSGSGNGLAIPCRDLPTVPVASKDVDRATASALALLYTGQGLVYTTAHMQVESGKLMTTLKTDRSEAVAKATEAHALAVSKAILAWAATDGYAQVKNNNGYQVSGAPEHWEPTPPGYMQPILPGWHRLRPFLIDSASQFRTTSPPSYSRSDTSEYVRSMAEVLEVSRKLSADQRDIAAFWDCNPFVMNTGGHAAFSAKKISPGGHWMGIAGVVSRQLDLPLDSTLYVHALLGVTLADAFIACWDQKYISQYIRPETAIRRDIDPAWVPVLQTPPFPEYTSGHSVVSTAAAEVLTNALGEVAFVDDVETSYGLPTRTFPSFRAAAREAAISRLYGGIHFRHAIDKGVTQGLQVADMVVGKLGN